MSMRLGKLSAVLLGACLVSAPVHGIELFGITFLEPDPPDAVEMIDPLPYSVQVIVNGGGQTAKDVVSASSSLVRDADRPASGRAGLLSTATADYARIVNGLYGVGRFGPIVSIQIDGHEASELPLDANLSAKPGIVIRVDAGARYRFGNLVVQGGPPGFEAGDIGFVQGEVASSDIIRQAGRALVRGWQERSHALADISTVDIVADHAAALVNVRLDVEAGPPVRYGVTSIDGTQTVDHAFVEYIANLPKGRPYHPDDIGAAQRRLVKLDTFRTVDVNPAEDLAPDGTLPIAIDLTKRKPRRFGFGATLSSVDGLGVEGFWLHRNILGRAERLRFDGSVAGIGRSTDPLDYDYEASVTFIKPGVFTPETEFRLRYAASREKLDNYDALVLETSAGLSANITDRLTAESNLVLERSRVDDSFGRRRFSILSLDNTLTYERRDVPLNARSGYFLEARVMPFVIDRNTEIGVRGTLEARAYQTLGQAENIVLAGRAKIGTVEGVSAGVAPPQVLFFSGGGGSVRGFEYLSNGVTTGSGTTGGHSLVELSGELRYDFDESLGGVAFVDAGNVGAGGFPDLTREWKVGAGVGIRFNTGLGPLRIDLARALNWRKGDPNFALYIGLGQAF